MKTLFNIAVVLGIGTAILSAFTPANKLLRTLNVATGMETGLNQQTPKQKKDFANTRYADNFVDKYRLNKKHIKTEADRTFEVKWNLYTGTTANYLQQCVMDCDYSEAQTELNRLSNDLNSYSAFLSYDCKTDWIEKLKQVKYKVSETLQAKRLLL